MAENYQVNTKILKPLAEVYQAVIDKNKLIHYFADKSNSDLVQGENVIWHWQEWGDYPVTVKSVVVNERIELLLNSRDWDKTKDESYDVTVTFIFEALNENETMLCISENGWRQDEQGLIASHQNCGGWMHMLMCLKAYIEHNIDLR